MTSPRDTLRRLWHQRPLLVIVCLFGLLEICAVIFARGYGMHDDHFCVIEIARDWIDGRDLPAAGTTELRNLLYIGAHYLFFRGANLLHITDPQVQMLLVRLLHGIYALLFVVLSYRIASRIGGPAVARTTGLVVALFWLFPFISVRNLVEFVCVVPLLAFTYVGMAGRGENRDRDWIVAGVCAALAFILRYQTASFLGVGWIILLLQRKFRGALLVALGGLAVVCLVLGLAEYIAFGKPFATVLNYFAYNGSAAAYAYVTNPWYTYLGTVAGFLLPPLSLAVLFGFASLWRRQPLIVWPTLVFFIIHSAYPNKQERFLLPILPLLLAAGLAAWLPIEARLRQRRIPRGLIVAMWAFFWFVNSLLLVIGTTTYSKRSRVEAMYFFHDKPAESVAVVESDGAMPPLPDFYSGRRMRLITLSGAYRPDSVAAVLAADSAASARYVLMFGDRNRSRRLQRLAAALGPLQAVTSIPPSIPDRLLFLINPAHNKNETCWVYRRVR